MSAQELFAQAQENYNMGILSLTEETLTALIAEYPNYAPAHHLLAKVAYDDNQTMETILSHYDNAIKADPNNQGYKHEKAYRNANFLYLNAGIPEAKKIATQILKENPNYAGANFLMGQILQNDFFEKNLEKTPEEQYSDENKKLALENDFETLKYFDKALLDDNTNQEWFITRGQLYQAIDFKTATFPRSNNEYLQKAVLDFTSAIDINTANEWGASAYIARSESNLLLEKFEDATFDLDMARTFVPHHTSNCLSAIASIKANYMNDYEGALTTLNELVDFVEASEEYSSEFAQSQKSSPYYERGKLKIEHLNQKVEGIADLKKASAYSPNDDFYKEEAENN